MLNRNTLVISVALLEPGDMKLTLRSEASIDSPRDMVLGQDSSSQSIGDEICVPLLTDPLHCPKTETEEVIAPAAAFFHTAPNAEQVLCALFAISAGHVVCRREMIYRFRSAALSPSLPARPARPLPGSPSPLLAPRCPRPEVQ